MVDELHNEGFTSRLVAGEGGYHLLRSIVVLLLLAGCVLSGYMFRQYIELNKDEPITIPPIESQSVKDAQRLDRVIGDFRAAVDTRTRSLTLASAVIEASRQPFIPTMKVTVASSQPSGGEGEVTVAGGDQVIPTYVREKIPPIMFVRAIMVAGKQAMAIMDIEGVGTGIIVRSGFSFSSGEGKVVRIGPDKVTVNWSGKHLDIAPGL